MRLDEMPSPTVVICDESGDVKENTDLIASFAPVSRVHHNDSSLLATFTKEGFYR